MNPDPWRLVTCEPVLVAAGYLWVYEEGDDGEADQHVEDAQSQQEEVRGPKHQANLKQGFVSVYDRAGYMDLISVFRYYRR